MSKRRVFRLYFDKDKETAWLNEMAAEGLAMTGFFAGLYTFDECEPGKYIYQVDIGDRFGSVSEDYRELMNEMDIEIIQNWGYWIILRREADKGAFELYTDVDSRIEHYSRILKLFKAVTVLELICLTLSLIGMSKTDDPALFFSVIVLSVVVLGFSAITLRTRETLCKLREQKTGIEEKRNNMSVILLIGLFTNFIRLCFVDRMSEPVSLITAITAIVLMLVGIAQVSENRRK